MNKKIILTALIFGSLAIILGAFAAHGLKKMLTPESLNSFETGVKYLMYHAFFLLFLSATSYISESSKKTPYYLTVFGTLLFSGSLFLLTTSSFTGINFKFLGPVTPVGGLLLVAAWLSLFLIVLKKK